MGSTNNVSDLPKKWRRRYSTYLGSAVSCRSMAMVEPPRSSATCRLRMRPENPSSSSWTAKQDPLQIALRPNTLIQVLPRDVLRLLQIEARDQCNLHLTVFPLSPPHSPAALYYISQLSATAPQYTENSDESMLLGAFIKRNVKSLRTQVQHSRVENATLSLQTTYLSNHIILETAN